MNNISWQKCIAGRQEKTGRVPGNGMISDFMLKSLDGMQPQSDAEMSITHQPELTEQIERCVQKLRYRVDTSLRLQLGEEEERLKNRVRHSLERLLLPLPPPFARSACLDSRSARHRRDIVVRVPRFSKPQMEHAFRLSPVILAQRSVNGAMRFR
jgi:hypothetical protein